MKRTLFATLFLALLLATGPAWALKTYNVTGLTGGTSRDLDYLSVDDLSDGDRAIGFVESGSSKYYYYFEYDATGTTAEGTSSHPYHVRPDDYATGGVWVEASVNWVEFDSNLSLNDLTVTGTLDNSSGTLSCNDVEAAGKLSGGVLYHRMKANTTVTGITKYGGYLTGVSEPSGQTGVTVTVDAATGAGENFVAFNERDTYSTGTTIYLHFNAADTIRSNQTITAGTSKFILEGTSPWDDSVVCFSGTANEWSCKTSGSPTVDWD